jgi:hypothetical protein
MGKSQGEMGPMEQNLENGIEWKWDVKNWNLCLHACFQVFCRITFSLYSMCSHTSRYLEVVHADSGIPLMIFGKSHEHDVMLPIWYVSSQMCTVKPGEGLGFRYVLWYICMIACHNACGWNFPTISMLHLTLSGPWFQLSYVLLEQQWVVIVNVCCWCNSAQ